MSTEITIVDEPSEVVAVEEPSNTDLAIDLAETVAEAVAETFSAEEAHDDNMAFIAGVTVAMLDAVIGRVDVLESRVDGLEVSQAGIAAVVEEVAEEVAASEVVEAVEESVPEPDEPPPTLKRKVSSAWFSKAKKP